MINPSMINRLILLAIPGCNQIVSNKNTIRYHTKHNQKRHELKSSLPIDDPLVVQQELVSNEYYDMSDIQISPLLILEYHR